MGDLQPPVAALLVLTGSQHHSTQQILELAVLGLFLVILLQEIQSWEWECGVETCAEAVALIRVL